MLIDSNILIYAINADSPKNKLAINFLKENLEYLEIAHQNIFETIRVLTHKNYSKPLKLGETIEAIFAILESCRIITPNKTSLYLALELIKKHDLTGNRIFDAYLAATALSNGIENIATDNVKDFRIFEGIKVINPFN